MNLITLLEICAGYGLFCYLVIWLLTTLKAPEPIGKAVTVLLVLVAVVWLLNHFLPNVAHLGLK